MNEINWGDIEAACLAACRWETVRFTSMGMEEPEWTEIRVWGGEQIYAEFMGWA